MNRAEALRGKKLLRIGTSGLRTDGHNSLLVTISAVFSGAWTMIPSRDSASLIVNRHQRIENTTRDFGLKEPLCSNRRV
jgi:hypothetical protein